MPIEFRQISENLEVLFCNWFSFIEKYAPVYQLFFDSMNEKVYPITEFLNLSQALEAIIAEKTKINSFR